MFDFSGTQKLILFVLVEWKLLLILTVLFALYFYGTSNFDLFEKTGVPHRKPTFLIGNLGPRLEAKQSFHEFQLELYNSFEGAPVYGVFEGRRPVYYIRDPELIKAIIVRDFDHFVDRNSLESNEPPYLKRTLINLKKKRDNGRQTGSAGGPSAKINTVDELVYLIIGTDSPVLDGMEIAESNLNIPAEPDLSLMDLEPSRAVLQITNNDNIQNNEPSTSKNIIKFSTIAQKTIQKPKAKKRALPTLKEEKIKLMIEYLKLKIEKTKKEILLLDKQANQNQQANQVPEFEIPSTSAQAIHQDIEFDVPPASAPIYEDAEYLDSDLD